MRLCGDRSSRGGKVTRDHDSPLVKRALNDITEFSREELGGYVVTESDKARKVFNHNTPQIELVGKDGYSREYSIPTSFFTIPSAEPFAWSVTDLVGCTSLVMVKTPTDKDPTSGLYLAHYWE